MASMFSPSASHPAIAPMIPQAAPALPTPKVQRMPTETDPSILAAAARTRNAAMRRTGRLSTILTDQPQDMVGSSGVKLGA